MTGFKWLPPFIGLSASALIPSAHIAILWYFWQEYARYVDRRFCTCSCWDTVFKGPYESGVASYKHMYFNATRNSFKIWVLTVVAVIALYESIKQLIELLVQRRIRFSMLLLFSLSLFSHYYAWWSYVNYYNDDYYQQWNHQLFFTVSFQAKDEDISTLALFVSYNHQYCIKDKQSCLDSYVIKKEKVTELASTTIIVHLANISHNVTTGKVLCVAGVALIHIVTSTFDQFFINVLKGEGSWHQIIRDICLMVADILQLIIPLSLLKQTREDIYPIMPRSYDKFGRKPILGMLLLMVILFIMCSAL